MTVHPCPPHYWLIEPPEGSQSLGACKYCGHEQWFQNSVEGEWNLPVSSYLTPATADSLERMAARSE